MRLIARIDNVFHAKRAASFLVASGVPCQILEDEDEWMLWVENDDDIARGQALLQEYLANPEKEIFTDAERAAQKILEQEQRENIKYRSRQHDVRTFWHRQKSVQMGPITIGILCIAIFTSFFSIRPNFDGMITKLYFSDVKNIIFAVFPDEQNTHIFDSILSGELWRLITPIFLHFSLLHIIFNSLWMRDLGAQIETHQGSLVLLSLIVVIGIISNITQAITSGPLFGGLSGVVYGLFGYVWMQARFAPGTSFMMHKEIVSSMLIWLVVCFTGLVGNIANAAHVSGLIAGVVIGYFFSGHWKKYLKGIVGS